MDKDKKIIDLEEERYGLFMNDESYGLEMMYGREYLKTDVNFIIKIYRLNIVESKSHSLYGQARASDKQYFPPVRIHAMVDIEDNEHDTYGSDEGGLVREDTGNIKLGIYLDELEENKIEVNRGDIIEYNLSGNRNRYYEVENANNVVDTSSQTIGGMTSYWKEVIGTPIKGDVTDLIGDYL